MNDGKDDLRGGTSGDDRWGRSEVLLVNHPSPNDDDDVYDVRQYVC